MNSDGLILFKFVLGSFQDLLIHIYKVFRRPFSGNNFRARVLSKESL